MTIAFFVALRKKDFDSDVGGWRCEALKLPGARVAALYASGAPQDAGRFMVLRDLLQIRWPSEPRPDEVLAEIRIDSELQIKGASAPGTAPYWVTALVTILTSIITAVGGYYTAMAGQHHQGIPGATSSEPIHSANETTIKVPTAEEKRKAQDAGVRVQLAKEYTWQPTVRVLLKARTPVEVRVAELPADPCVVMAPFLDRQPVTEDVLEECRRADAVRIMKDIWEVDNLSKTRPARFQPFRPKSILAYQALNLLFYQLSERYFGLTNKLKLPEQLIGTNSDAPEEQLLRVLNDAAINCDVGATTMDPIRRRASLLSLIERDGMGYTGALVFAQEGEPAPEPARTNVWRWLFDLQDKVPMLARDPASPQQKGLITILALADMLRAQYDSFQKDLSSVVAACAQISGSKP